MAKYLIGIDGGGTKTDFLLTDYDYNEVGRLIAPRSNPNDIGIDALKKLVRDGVNELLNKANVEKEDVSAAFAGIAGLTSADYSKQISNLLAVLLPC